MFKNNDCTSNPTVEENIRIINKKIEKFKNSNEKYKSFKPNVFLIISDYSGGAEYTYYVVCCQLDSSDTFYSGRNAKGMGDYIQMDSYYHYHKATSPLVVECNFNVITGAIEESDISKRDVKEDGHIPVVKSYNRLYYCTTKFGLFDNPNAFKDVEFNINKNSAINNIYKTMMSITTGQVCPQPPTPGGGGESGQTDKPCSNTGQFGGGGTPLKDIKLFLYANNVTKGTIKLSKPQVEVGTFATDWRPNPSDYVERNSPAYKEIKGLAIQHNQDQNKKYIEVQATDGTVYGVDLWGGDAKKLLEQQQAEIEELKKMVQTLETKINV